MLNINIDIFIQFSLVNIISIMGYFLKTKIIIKFIYKLFLK